MSATPARSARSAETLAGLVAAAAMAMGLVAIAYRPIRVGVPAVLLALIATGIGGRHARLAAVALALTTVCWMVGMVVAVLTKHLLY